MKGNFYSSAQPNHTDKMTFDASTFEEAYQKHWNSIFSYAYKRTGSKEIAEEMVQELFTKLWERRKTLTIDTECLPGYLHTAIKYIVVNHYQSKKVRNEFMRDAYHRLEVENTTEQQLLFNEAFSAFEKAINILPKQCKRVFKMSREEHYSMKEIATRLSISPKTVENHLSKAVKTIRMHMKDFVLMLSLVLFQ